MPPTGTRYPGLGFEHAERDDEREGCGPGERERDQQRPERAGTRRARWRAVSAPKMTIAAISAITKTSLFWSKMILIR